MNTYNKLYLLFVSMIVVAPYAIAFVLGLCNGTFMKFHNLKKIAKNENILFRSTRGFVNPIIYCVSHLSFCEFLSSMLAVSIASGRYELRDLIIVSVFALSVLYLMMFLFCEVAVTEKCVYIYNLHTMFSVTKIPLDEVVEYGYGGFGRWPSAIIKTNSKSYRQFLVNNPEEYFDVMQTISGASNEQ